MIEKTFSVGDSPRLVIRFTSGTIEVHEGAPGQTRVWLDTAAEDDFVVEQSGDTVTVQRRPGRRGWIQVELRSSHLRAEVPRGTELTVSSASADLRCDVDLGAVTVDSASGDVELRSVAALRVKTASGDIDAERVEGDLQARTASGDLEVAAVNGRVDVTTASGEVRIGSVGASATVTTASGDIVIDRFLGSDLGAKSLSGSLRVGFPPGTRIKMEARTMSGRIRRPESRPTSGQSGNEVRARLSTVSGDIEIERAG